MSNMGTMVHGCFNCRTTENPQGSCMGSRIPSEEATPGVHPQTIRADPCDYFQAHYLLFLSYMSPRVSPAPTEFPYVSISIDSDPIEFLHTSTQSLSASCSSPGQLASPRFARRIPRSILSTPHPIAHFTQLLWVVATWPPPRLRNAPGYPSCTGCRVLCCSTGDDDPP